MYGQNFSSLMCKKLFPANSGESEQTVCKVEGIHTLLCPVSSRSKCNEM